jgi:hypothetical protein
MPVIGELLSQSLVCLLENAYDRAFDAVILAMEIGSNSFDEVSQPKK